MHAMTLLTWRPMNKPRTHQDSQQAAIPAVDMPHSPEAERGVLGAILLSNGGKPLALAVEAGITAASFHDSKTRLLWEAMRDMAAKGFAIDQLTLIQRLRENGTLDEVGGPVYVEGVMDATPTAAHAGYYVEIVRDKEGKRNIVAAGQKAIADAVSGDYAWDALCAKTETEFASIARTMQLADKRTVAAIGREAVKAWEDNAAGIAPVGIQTGISWLDEATAGVLKGSYWVISGRPGSCKSTMCRMIAESVAARGQKVTIKTTEQTPEQYIGAMIAARAKVSVHHLNRPYFPADRLKYIRDAEAAVARWPIEIDGDMATRSQLGSWYLGAASSGSELLILDYLQDVLPESKDEARSPEQKVSLATQEMRRCSKITKAPIIVVSTESNAGDLRYSGQVEYDATLWGRMSKAEDFEPMHNPKYIFEFKKSRFAPSGTRVELFYLYGVLLPREEYEGQLAVMTGRAALATTPTTAQGEQNATEDAPF